MNTYDIRLIALDMDGTLLNSSQLISKENRNALKLAMERGVAIAICSGRLAGDAGTYAIENGFEECAILSLNGAYCLERPMGEAYANHVMTDATLLECVKLIDEDHAQFCCFAQNRFVAVNETPENAVRWSGHMEVGSTPAGECGLEALKSIRADGVNKIVYIEPDAQRQNRMRERLSKVDGLEVTSSWSDNLELMPLGITKGAAVAELANKLGLTSSQVMTVGDNDNDESMIAYAGLGVAMGNATETIKRAASFITLSNDEDGVAAAIRRFVL